MTMYYTNQQCSDGMGAQYQKMIETYIYCKLNNLEYRYCPLNHVEHNYDKNPNFVSKLEQLFNLKPNIKNGKKDECEQINFGHVIWKWFEDDIDTNSNNVHMDFVKKCFWENKVRPTKSEIKNVAVHIRRENLHDYGKAGSRAATPNEYYLKVMGHIRQTHRNVRFNIYSQGELSNFSILLNNDVIFHLNEDVCDTFFGMVSADILVISPSSFSYAAAIISDGIVYYKKFWHKPKSNWLVLFQ